MREMTSIAMDRFSSLRYCSALIRAVSSLPASNNAAIWSDKVVTRKEMCQDSAAGGILIDAEYCHDGKSETRDKI